jgi:hypothetical protein
MVEQFKLVEGLPPAADAAGRTGDYISLKNAHACYVVAHITQGNAAAVTVSINQATAVAGTGSKVITNTVPIWANTNVAASDTLVRQTDAVNYATGATTTNKVVVFQIEPASLDVAGGFDCITAITSASNAANITEVMYYLDTRYKQATPPAAITD